MPILTFGLCSCDSADPGQPPAPRDERSSNAVPPIKGELAEAYRLIERGQTGPARIRTRRWMDTHGEDARALFLFGLAYHHERRYMQSAEWFRRSIEAAPVYPPSAHFLGWSAYYLGDTETSRQAFTRHLDMSPGEGDSHYGLGLLALDAGQLQDAERHFTIAIELQENQPGRIDGLSKALVRLAEVDELRGNRLDARAHLEQAVTTDPDRTEGWYRLARCCRRLGDSEAADEAERQHASSLDRSPPRGGFPE